MKLIIKSIKIKIEEDTEENYLKLASEKLGLDLEMVQLHSILSKALDVRDQQNFYYKLILVVDVPDSYKNHHNHELYQAPLVANKQTNKISDMKPVVVGFGPAGMFAAIELIHRGYEPIIFERGKSVDERSVDVQSFIANGKLNSESNIQFGEGGAGTYSDGKLFSRRNNNVSYVSRVLDTLIEFGAPPEISYIAKPHLGTDVLCKIVRNIREFIIENGGEIHFNSKLTDILIENKSIAGVQINDEREYDATHLFLAIGHSARETYRILADHRVALEQRRVSIGVRIEHAASTIDLFRYGQKYQNYVGLGAATYSVNYTNKKKKTGAYTFCMCPGGQIVNASSEEGHHVVNGMSYSHRSSPYSNAALVVPCETFLFGDFDDPLAGIEFQRGIEKKAFLSGGSDWKAPAQNLYDFLEKHSTNISLPETSYSMGLEPADMREILPEHVVTQLVDAFKQWQTEYPLFVAEEAVLVGAETRTSSPVRILRDDNYQSVNTKGLYPIGEGAGYTGGITSSAADGVRVIDSVLG